MGIKIKSDFDSIADDALNITGSATGWASRMSDVVDALKSNNNELGTAALTDKTTTGTTGDSGKVPALNSDGKINAVQLPTATAGGSANSGLVPILDGERATRFDDDSERVGRRWRGQQRKIYLGI